MPERNCTVSLQEREPDTTRLLSKAQLRILNLELKSIARILPLQKALGLCIHISGRIYIHIQ